MERRHLPRKQQIPDVLKPICRHQYKCQLRRHTLPTGKLRPLSSSVSVENLKLVSFNVASLLLSLPTLSFAYDMSLVVDQHLVRHHFVLYTAVTRRNPPSLLASFASLKTFPLFFLPQSLIPKFMFPIHVLFIGPH